MTEKISFSVPGLPRGKGRPRAYATIVKRADGPDEAVVRLVTPQATRDAEAAVRAAFRARHRDHRPWTGAVMIRFTAVFPIPASWPKRLKEAARRGDLFHTAKPDKDNIEKLVADALKSIAWVDDAQVQGGGVKRYGEPPRVDVTLEHYPAPAGAGSPSERERIKRASQPELALPTEKGCGANPTKSQSRKVPPDLSGWSPRQRALIEAAMRRDEQARRKP